MTFACPAGAAQQKNLVTLFGVVPTLVNSVAYVSDAQVALSLALGIGIFSRTSWANRSVRREGVPRSPSHARWDINKQVVKNDA